MSNRLARASIAQQTLSILETGHYTVNQQSTQIGEALTRSVAGTEVYSPEQLENLLLTRQPCTPQATQILVKNETTFAGARALQKEYGEQTKVMCLNFASAKNPGGGFIGGSQAQEECLARASGLYTTLIEKGEGYYKVNRACRTALYTDHMIYSPNVPVFRDDQDALLAEPWACSIVTAPAVNYGALKAHETSLAHGVMIKRIHLLLALAEHKGYRHLVLGAWGCGVFRNDPKDIAQMFASALTEDGPFAGRFQSVRFSVWDNSRDGRTLNSFTECLQSNSR